MTFDREAGSSDALLTDLYLDALLAGAVLDPSGAPRLDPAARDAADRTDRTADRADRPADRADRTDPRAVASEEAEALVVDRYLESLLARRPVAIDGVPADLGATAHRLAAGLPRYHPSFRFEERLATRLAEAAVALRVPIAAGAEGRIVPFRGVDRDPDGVLPELDDPAVVATLDAVRRGAGRPLLIGGALTSAALSIAGAAWVAWRLGRPRAESPMVRAARAVREARELAAQPGPSRRSRLD